MRQADKFKILLEAPVKPVKPGYGGFPPIHGSDAYDSDKPAEAGKKHRKWTHPLDLLFAKKQISHELWLAGVRFRSDWELAHSSHGGVVNWSRLAQAVHETDRDRDDTAWPVRQPKQPIAYREVTPRIVDTWKELTRLSEAVTPVGFALLVAVCGRGMTIEDVARVLGDDRKYLGRRFREALEEAHQFYFEKIEGRERT
jgi:hypothetical protein